MIVGVGIDLIETERVRRSAERFGQRFLSRIYHPRELEQTRGDRVQYLAARFAVKEAVFKALGTGWAAGIRWIDVEVQNLTSGQPILLLHGGAAQRAREMGADRFHVSITHTAGYAAAVAVLETTGTEAPSARSG
ncbi:MAG: holo-ACP synthase [Candidatus Eisenbacteria bacterium]|nr:holo-ACP synthase [Candidatus Eisenbacteria bacterium]